MLASYRINPNQSHITPPHHSWSCHCTFVTNCYQATTPGCCHAHCLLADVPTGDPPFTFQLNYVSITTHWLIDRRLHCPSLTHSRSDTQYLPPADTPSAPAAPAPVSKGGVDDYGRSSTRDEGYPEEKASTPAPAAASMWDWSQFTTNTSPFKDKGTVKDKGSKKDKNKETGKSKDKDKSSVKDMETGLVSSPFESTRREASRLRYVTLSHDTRS